MPRWRRYPPVHASLPWEAFRSALYSLSESQAKPALRQAREALAAQYPGREVVLLHSGTAALQLALESTRGAFADACVALPAYACPDVGTAAVGAGFGVVLYDLDPQTLQPDQSSLVAALEAGATHVVVTHLFGRLADVPRVVRTSAEFGAIVIEDAAQHAGGTMHGIRGGALAPLSILSFGRGKGLNAGGGGALLFEPNAIGAIAPSPLPASPALRSLLVAMGVSMFSHPALYALVSRVPGLGLGETHYRAPEGPRDMHSASAALLATALVAEPGALRARRDVELLYESELAGSPSVRCDILEGTESGALRYPVRIGVGTGQSLAGLGVARSYPRTLEAYAEIAAVLRARVPTPGATELAATLHTLPTHALLDEPQRMTIVRSITKT